MPVSIEYDTSGSNWIDHHDSGNCYWLSVNQFLVPHFPYVQWRFLLQSYFENYWWKHWTILLLLLMWFLLLFKWNHFLFIWNLVQRLHICFCLELIQNMWGLHLIAFFNVEKIHLKLFLTWLKYTTYIFFCLLSFEYMRELERSDLNWGDQQSVLESMKFCWFTLAKSMA